VAVRTMTLYFGGSKQRRRRQAGDRKEIGGVLHECKQVLVRDLGRVYSLVNKGRPVLEWVPIGPPFLLRDIGDSTFHAGGGDWTHDEARAERYDTRAAAEQAVEDVDRAALLRDRLRIVPAPRVA
jgi:hypothetical protein